MAVRRNRKGALGKGVAVVLLGGFAAAGFSPEARAAQTSTLPDAQVEANVLKALASAPELSTQDVQSSTVYGVVRLSGTVQTEALRVQAENLAARATGVKKVVDELALGTPTQASTETPAGSQQPYDGEAAATGGQPEPAEPATPYAGASSGVNAGNGAYGPQTAEQNAQTAPAQQPYAQQPYAQPPAQQPYAQQPYTQQPYAQQGQDPNQQPYPSQAGNAAPYPPAADPRYGRPAYPAAGYGQQQPPYPSAAYGQQRYGPQGPYAAQGGQVQGGQVAGLPVTVPGGSLLQVRINRGLDSNHIQAGTPFNGTVLGDVAANGVIAIPRGASVQGVVVDAHRAGVLKGEGELALQITGISLGGTVYPLTSDVWAQQGRDKSVRTVNSALGLGVLGAIVGGVAGGGAGAAVGAGVGAGVGVAGSAASPGGQVIVPPEAVLTFHLAQPAELRTVSQGEMQRLAYAAGPAYGARPVVRRRVYPYPYGPYGSPYAYRYPY